MVTDLKLGLYHIRNIVQHIRNIVLHIRNIILHISYKYRINIVYISYPVLHITIYGHIVSPYKEWARTIFTNTTCGYIASRAWPCIHHKRRRSSSSLISPNSWLSRSNPEIEEHCSTTRENFFPADTGATVTIPPIKIGHQNWDASKHFSRSAKK